MTGPALAQERPAAESDSACAAVLRSRRLPGAGCRSLAVAIVTRTTEDRYRPDARAVQDPAPRPAATGSAAQAEAVPPIQPLAATGVSIAAAGTDSGARSLVAITVNPALLFVSPGDAEAMATASRIADLTLLLPLDPDHDDDGRIDYVGARLRLNLIGARAGRRVRQAAQSFLRAIQGEADLVNEVFAALRRAPSAESCAAALLEPRSSASLLSRRCNGPIDLSTDPALYREMEERMGAARAEADAGYLGLEVRFDRGDPTLSATVPPDAIALQSGLGLGRRVLGGDRLATSAAVRARGGLRYTHLPEPGPAGFAFDGALGLELSRPLDLENAITASAGLEFRYGGKAAEDYTLLRLGLNVPVAGGAGVSVGFSTPLDGEISPVLTVNVNWSLLLPRVFGGLRRGE